MEIVRFSLVVLLFSGGLFVLGTATIGLYRMGFVLNRMHAAACDVMGAMLILLGTCVLLGFSFTTLKLLFLITFICLTNPVSVQMIGRAELLTNPFLEDEVEVVKR